MNKLPVITISREYGSGGRAIGERVAKELGVPKSGVQVARGETSHHKLLLLDCDQEHVDRWLSRLPSL